MCFAPSICTVHHVPCCAPHPAPCTVCCPQVILAEVSPQGFLRSLDDTEELSTAGQGAPLYALQAPPEAPAGTGRRVGLVALVASYW